MISKEAYINHEKGIHARVAAMIVQKAREIEELNQVKIYLEYKEKKEILATNMMPLVSLQIKQGDTVLVRGRGKEAEIAVDEMVGFLESDFQVKDAQTIREIDSVIQDTTFTAEQVFSSMANGLLVIDENDVVTIFNPAAERILGLSANEIIGKKIYEVFPNSHLHVVRSTRKAELSQKQEIGDSVIISNRTPIVVDGVTRGAIAIFEDISALEQTGGELREVKELKERLHLVLESVQDGICVVNKEGKITYVNPAYVKIVGQELINKNVWDISPKGTRARVLETGKPILGAISQKPNGVTIVSNVNPIIVEGEITGVVSIVRDLTEVQELMEKLNQITAKAEYLEQELIRAKQPHQAFKKIIGRNSKLTDSLAAAGKAAATTSTVLIRGESGTGKELVAEGIHYSSPRSTGPFIRVNCAAIPANLLESELFGHERGAFTGAIKRKLGKFELAHQGTIFLDEIGEMERQMQVKLLRVIQERQFERVGGEETIGVDVRIIAATNKNLEEMVQEGSFREDLYYRLNVIPIFLPPLRERRDDIPILVEHFMDKFNQIMEKGIKGIRGDALEVLLGYNWPGNVRELENIIERIVTLTDSKFINIDELPAYLRKVGNSQEVLFGEESILTWEEYEKQIITRALEKYGSYNRAGKALGLTHKTIANKARKYGIEKQISWEKGT